MTALGIFGGTFDPVHYGHLRLAEEACEALRLSGVTWIPAGQPRHRDSPGSPARHRLEMVRRAVAGRAGFAVDTGEAESTEPSYTVPTLQRLRAEHGSERPLVLLLGSDAFLGLATWHRWRDLFELVHIAVATRPGYALAADFLEPPLAEELRSRQVDSPAALSAESAGCILSFAMTPLAITATAIRERLSAGQSARYLLPDGVLDYISSNQLYRSPESP